MAKQVGPILLSGTMGGVTFYQLNGTSHAKMKNRSMSPRRYKNSPSMEATRRNAACFARAQKLSAELYHRLPAGHRDQKKIWYPLRNRAQELVRSGIGPLQILEILNTEVLPALLKKAGFLKAPSPALPLKPAIEHPEIQLGRHYGPVHRLSLLDELTACNHLLQNLLHTNSNVSSFQSRGEALRPTGGRRR